MKELSQVGHETDYGLVTYTSHNHLPALNGEKVAAT